MKLLMQMNITVVIVEGFLSGRTMKWLTRPFSLPFTIRPVKVTVPIQLRCHEKETNNFKWGHVDFLSVISHPRDFHVAIARGFLCPHIWMHHFWNSETWNGKKCEIIKRMREETGLLNPRVNPTKSSEPGGQAVGERAWLTQLERSSGIFSAAL